MLTFIIIIIMVAAILLVGVVLIQNPKGGIAANFVAPSQIMGVKRSTDVIEKATWGFALVLIVLSLASNMFRPSSNASDNSSDSRIKDAIENTTVTTPAPAAPEQQQAEPNAAPADAAQPAATEKPVEPTSK